MTACVRSTSRIGDSPRTSGRGRVVALALSVTWTPGPAAGQADVGLAGILKPIQDVAQCRNELGQILFTRGRGSVALQWVPGRQPRVPRSGPGRRVSAPLPDVRRIGSAQVEPVTVAEMIAAVRDEVGRRTVTHHRRTGVEIT